MIDDDPRVLVGCGAHRQAELTTADLRVVHRSVAHIAERASNLRRLVRAWGDELVTEEGEQRVDALDPAETNARTDAWLSIAMMGLSTSKMRAMSMRAGQRIAVAILDRYALLHRMALVAYLKRVAIDEDRLIVRSTEPRPVDANSSSSRVTFLRALRHPLTAAFWAALERDHAGAPAALRELARGDSSVVCDRAEAEASLAWAPAHWAWTESPQPVVVVGS